MHLSIIIAMYNAEATVERTLASLTKLPPERRHEVEAIVVNDGSTDRGPDVVAHFASTNTDLGIVRLDKDNGGSASARNLGLERARGEWILFLDADDELATNPLAHLPDTAETTVVGFSVQRFVHGKPGRHLRPVLITAANHLDVFTAGNPVYPPAFVFRRAAMREPFDETLRTLEDWVFWMRNDGIFAEMRLLPDITIANIHVHGGNKSSRYAWRGGVRESIAEDAMQRFAPRLTAKTRNNLRLQRAIGRLQQGKPLSPKAMVRFPVDPVLYGKLWVYFTLGGWFGRFEVYGRAARQTSRQ